MSKIVASKQQLVNGKKIINGYIIRLKKSELEKTNFKEKEEIKIIYEKNRIIITK